jgi:hypothetical protein
MKIGIRKHESASLKLSYNTNVPAHLRGGLMEITHVESGHKRQGHATQLMRNVCAEASENDVILLLMPRPFGTFDMTREELTEWYQRLGFAVLQQSPLLLVRPPNADNKAKIKPIAAAVEDICG